MSQGSQQQLSFILSGCSDDQNCPDTAPICNGDHRCQEGPGIPSITIITVSTSSCASCTSGNVEEGLQLDLVGRFGAECSTDVLDNTEQHDYGSNYVAQFNSTFLGGNDDHGLGQCNNVSLLSPLTSHLTASHLSPLTIIF